MTEERSLQNLFNQAYLGVINQGGPSVDRGNKCFKCFYRGPNGLKCGIGHLVTDEECKGWDDEASPGIELLYGAVKTPAWINSENIKFLAKIQRAHDSIFERGESFISQYKYNMHNIASEYNLTVPSSEKID